MSLSSMDRRQFLKMMGFAASGTLLAACAAPAAPGAAPAASTGGEVAAPAAADASELEIFSWWTSGGEVEALDALYAVFKEKYPDVEIQNAALSGGAGQGGNMKALLETRMMGGQPPDSFQVHLGRELIDSHVVADRMEPLDDLYAEEGYYDVFPQDLIDIASNDGHPWSVPVNIHRSNVLWYRPSKLAEIGIDAAPTTWDEFFQVADQLKEAGIPAFQIAGSDPNFNGHVLESILLSVLGPDKYRGLFTGETSWEDEGVTQSLEILNRLYDYTSENYLSVGWGEINDYFAADDGAAMMIMGDWTNGALKTMGFEDFRWAPAPGTDGHFLVLSDSFGLPKNAPNREGALNFLRVAGSKEGQDAFNPPKGSIPARTDADPSVYDEYQLSAIDDFAQDIIVPSLQHGAAAKQSFLLDYDLALSDLLANRDVASTQALLVQAAEDAGFGE